MSTPTENLAGIRRVLSIESCSPADLLCAYAVIVEELRDRGLCRTKNNPVAGYCEWLVSTRLGLSLRDNSSTGYDATDPADTKYEIKARRVTPSNPSLQLSVIRGLELRHFDYLVGVIFEADFSIRYAAKLPHAVVVEHATYRKHVNGHVLHLRKSLFSCPGVEDVTRALAGA